MMAVVWSCQTGNTRQIANTTALTALMLTSVPTVTGVSIVIYGIFQRVQKENYNGLGKVLFTVTIECQESNHLLQLVTIRDKCLKPSVPLISISVREQKLPRKRVPTLTRMSP